MKKAAKLGIYFGIKGINIIQSKAKEIAKSIHIPQEKFSGAVLEEKIPPEVKIVALIKDEFRKQEVITDEAGIAVSGRDLIIRSFELPSSLPREELLNAVNFEVKKYLPFKTEDLVSNFQLKLYKKEKKNMIIFYGIKKETIDSYLSIMEQLGLKVLTLEYSAFSVLRLAKLFDLKIKGVFALVEIDLDDETNFMILEDGFVLFSRDIDFSSMVEPDLESLSERLKSEIQLSLDYYYHRKFPSKPIDNIILFGPQEYKGLADNLSQELGLSARFIDISEYINKGRKFNLTEIKAYGVSLTDSTKLPLRFDLLSKWKNIERMETEAIKALSIRALRPNSKVLGVSLVIFILAFMIGLFQRAPLRRELNRVISTRPELITVSTDKHFIELEEIVLDYNDKTATAKKLLNRTPYLTPQLNALPELLPKGVWLEEINFLEDDLGRYLLLKGFAYLEDHNMELKAINSFFSSVKKIPEFSDAFQTIDVVSIERVKIGESEATKFAITCKH